MMVKKISKLFFWLGIGFVSFVALFALVFTLLPLTTPYLQSHKQTIENLAADILEQPVRVSTISISHTGLTPTIRLHKVQVLDNSKQAVLLNIKTMQVGVSLWQSLLKRRISISSVLISDMHLSLYQDKEGNISLSPQKHKIAPHKKHITLNDFLTWLFSPKHIHLHQVMIDWHGHAGSGLTIKFKSLALAPGQTIKKALPEVKKAGFSTDSLASLGFKLSVAEHAVRVKPASHEKSKTNKLIVWLNRAFAKEDLISGNVNLYGLLNNEAATNQKNKFLLALEVHGANLDYFPAWPPLKNVSALLLFDGDSLRIYGERGSIAGAIFHQVNAAITNLKTKPTLQVIGPVATNMRTGLRFINSSPLKKDVGRGLRGLLLTGPLNLDLNLNIPFTGKKITPKVLGKIALQNNVLTIPKWGIKISNIQGDLRFTRQDLSAPNLSGNLFTYPATFRIKTLNKGTHQRITAVTIAGKIAGESLSKKFAPQATTPPLQGTINYTAALQLFNNNRSTLNNTLRINSDLAGLAINLPPPFAKSAATTEHLTILLKLQYDVLQKLTLAYAKKFALTVTFGKTKQRFATGLSAIRKLESKLIPAAAKVSVRAQIAQINWPGWQHYFAHSLKSSPAKEKNLLAKAATRISKIELNITRLNLLGQNLAPAQISVLPKSSTKKLTVNMISPKIRGSLSFSYAKNYPLLTGHFSKLYLTTAKKDLSALNPKNIYPLAITSSNFQYNDQYLGRIKLVTKAIHNGLQIKNLSVQARLFTLTAYGNWRLSKGSQQTNLRGRLETKSLGNLLRRWHLGNNVNAGFGGTTFALSWQAAPFAPQFKTLQGDVKLAFYNGQIINLGQKTEAEIGLGRFLNLLSLQHFFLDFSDLTKQGFAFDEIKGDLDIEKGNVFTQNLILKGRVAAIQAQGRVGLTQKDYALKLITTPHITSSLPVVATIAGGPIAGAVTWLADKLISRPGKGIITSVYLVTGPWSKPQITKVAR